MATMIHAARNLCYEAAWLLNNDKIDHSLIAMVRWFAGEIAVKRAGKAIQIQCRYGYMDEYKVQRLYRDAKIVEPWEGAKEIEKLIIAGNLLA